MVSPFLSIVGGAAQGLNSIFDSEDAAQQKLDEINSAKIASMAPGLNKQYNDEVKKAQEVIAKKKAIQTFGSSSGFNIPEEHADILAKDPNFKADQAGFTKISNAKFEGGDPNYKSTLRTELDSNLARSKSQTNALLNRPAPQASTGFFTNTINSAFGRGQSEPEQPQGVMQPPAGRAPSAPGLGRPRIMEASVDGHTDGTVPPAVAAGIEGAAPGLAKFDGQESDAPMQGTSANAAMAAPQPAMIRFPTEKPVHPWFAKITDPNMAIRIPNTETAVATARANGVPDDQVALIEKMPFGQALMDQQLALKKAGAIHNDVSVKVGQKDDESANLVLNQRGGKALDSLEKDVLGAQSVVRNMQAFKAISAGVYTGTMASTYGDILKLAKGLGVELNGDLNTYVGKLEAMQGITGAIAGSFKGDLPGSMSDADRQFLIKRAPSLSNTVAGNRMLIDFYMRVSQNIIEGHKATNAFVNGKVGESRPADYADRLKQAPAFAVEWFEKHQAITPDELAKADKLNKVYDTMEPAGTNKAGIPIYVPKGQKPNATNQFTLPEDLQ